MNACPASNDQCQNSNITPPNFSFTYSPVQQVCHFNYCHKIQKCQFHCWHCDTKASIYYKVVLFILQPMKRPDSPVYMNSVVFNFLIIWLAVWGKIKRCATDKSDDLLQYPFHPLGTTVAHKDPTLPKLQAALYSLTVTHMHPTYRVFMKWYGVHQDSSSFTWQHQTALYVHHFSGYLHATAQWVC